MLSRGVRRTREQANREEGRSHEHYLQLEQAKNQASESRANIMEEVAERLKKEIEEVKVRWDYGIVDNDKLRYGMIMMG